MTLRELKVCLLGDTGVGKSSIVWRFVEDNFDPNINPTIGASFMTKTVQYQNELHKFLIWDTAGQERDSFQTLKNWVKELRQHGPPNIVDYADSIHAIFVETSAKNAININEVFIEISQRIPVLDAGGGAAGNGFKLRQRPSETRTRTCC
ncbi:unnamed protein product [Coregonus sp. 'balchen']|nr:unnamed protein product [Coregonus sp. 'balchen']